MSLRIAFSFRLQEIRGNHERTGVAFYDGIMVSGSIPTHRRGAYGVQVDMRGRIGVAVTGGDSRGVLKRIQQAEEMGIHAAWVTTGGARQDGLTVLAAAADHTQRILLGTSITPTWPRHPIVVVQQARVIADLAPGRFRHEVKAIE
jgi:hypothetical protein